MSSIAEEIRRATTGLNQLAGYVPASAWDQIRAIRSDLAHAADQAERLEREFMVVDHYYRVPDDYMADQAL